MRSRYWSCSKFADWLRGTMKPKAETSEGWEKWSIEAETKYPYRYWLAEEGLDILQKIVFFVPDQIHNVKYAFANRFITKSHTLTSNLKRWTWHEMDERILHCLFDELVNFVEVELAAANFRFDEEARKKYKAPFWSFGWFRTRTYRNAEAGVDYLNWARNLKVDETWGVNPGEENYGVATSQAQGAQEVLELYMWWTLGRPLRKDPYDESGWSAHCAERRELSGNLFHTDWEERTPEEKEKVTQLLDKLRELEAKHDAEDEAMLIRLIKVRKYLWT